MFSEDRWKVLHKPVSFTNDDFFKSLRDDTLHKARFSVV